MYADHRRVAALTPVGVRITHIKRPLLCAADTVITARYVSSSSSQHRVEWLKRIEDRITIPVDP